MSIRIVAYGIPGPQGSKDFVGLSALGKGRMIESSKKVKPWRQAVEQAARLAMPKPWKPLDGALAVRMIFTLARPKSVPRRLRFRPDRTPDLSKLARSTEDALTTAGVWSDDARVVEYVRLAKVYVNEDPEALGQPGVVVEVFRLRDPTIELKAVAA